MSALNLESARKRLQAFEFEELFVEELGWDRHRQDLTVSADGCEFTLKASAHKRGFVVFVCEPGPGAPFPPYAVRRSIEVQVAKHAHEHLIVFIDAPRTRQIWQWVRRETGQPLACRELRWYAGQTGEPILQRLSDIAISLDEEERLTLVAVAGKVRKALDVDKVTKRFYDRFKGKRDAFAKAIAGIADEKKHDWYASVMLNRLMFVYFVQKKGFLDGDTDYLRAKLKACRARFGADRFYSFYSTFLLRLFHDGLGSPRASWPADLPGLVGNVPYLDGGIFLPHQIENEHPGIAIPDSAFVELFDFFDEYRWHLDERPNRDDKEINPDVLGYIFEKYINQKEMGAYYTKEDITEYIGRSTIVPRLFDMAAEKCAVAFEEGGPVWSLLSAEPDRYIYEPVRRGVVLADGSILAETALPDFVQIGMHDPKARMFDKRYNLSEAQLHDAEGAKLTLPTETWREYVERRKRCLELREKLRSGEVHEVNDLITYNLDLRQLAEDAIGRCGPDLLMAFWRALTGITVLDPTVGSGAFLFAALNILYPLYEACLDQMESLVGDEASPAPSGGRGQGGGGTYEEFSTILARMAEHPNRRYYILKTIIVNNLFGVDIMQEAVEICKLRLFLKLAAQVDRVEQVEPLPDIDFNIRCGNTLVGYARIEDIDRLWAEVEKGKLISERDHSKLQQLVKEYAVMLDYWRRGQLGLEVPRMVGKAELEHARNLIVPELDRDLRRLYLTAQKLDDRVTVEEFRRTHQPFHWFVEFPQAMATGGFDVVIGNPPYVEYRHVGDYRVLHRYESLGNLHAMVLRRATEWASSHGRMSLIVPVALAATDRFRCIRAELERRGTCWVTSYGIRPSKLFEGAEQRLMILVLASSQGDRLWTSGYTRWNASERGTLLARARYGRAPADALRPVWPKTPSPVSTALVEKVAEMPVTLADLTGCGEAMLFYKNTGIGYFTLFMRDAPKCAINGIPQPSSRETRLSIRARTLLPAIHCLLNSSLCFLMDQVHSNCRDLNPSDITSMRVPRELVRSPRFDVLSLRLEEALQAGSWYQTRQQKLTGEVRIQSFTPSCAKPIIDQIDQVLAEHYGFTDEELDFIINYDIKYRMGTDAGEE